MRNFNGKPLDERSFAELMLKATASGRISFKEVDSLIAYVEDLKRGKDNASRSVSS